MADNADTKQRRVVKVDFKFEKSLMHTLEIDAEKLASGGTCEVSLVTFDMKDGKPSACETKEVVVEPGKGTLWVVRAFLNQLPLG